MFCILIVSFCLLPSTQIMWAVWDDSSKEAFKCGERTQRAAVCIPKVIRWITVCPSGGIEGCVPARIVACVCSNRDSGVCVCSNGDPEVCSSMGIGMCPSTDSGVCVCFLTGIPRCVPAHIGQGSREALQKQMNASLNTTEFWWNQIRTLSDLY